VFARVNSFLSCSVVSLTVNGEIRAPGDQLGDVVAGDFGDQLVPAEELDEPLNEPPRVGGGGVMLADFRPIAPRDVIEAEREGGGFLLRDERPRLLAFGAFYRFRGPFARGLG
jgi:hypothetical protein